MELLFRKYFWTINLACLALAAFLIARTANTFVASLLEPKVDPKAMAGPLERKVAPPRLGGSSIHAEATAKLFGVELPKLEEAVASTVEATSAVDPNAAPVKSSLRASLIGTMVANRPEYSLSTLRDDTTQDVGVYMVDETFLGAEIEAIERLRVILHNQGRREYIALKEDTTVAAVTSAPVTAVSKEPDRTEGDGVKCEGDNCEVSRAIIDERLSNLSKMATEARIVPSFKDGVANGFKLFSIRPGSLYSQIGIQNGDVIRRINGYEINSPDKALEVYAKLKESSKIDIELERRGQPLKKSYSIR